MTARVLNMKFVAVSSGIPTLVETADSTTPLRSGRNDDLCQHFRLGTPGCGRDANWRLRVCCR
jgi:hypothetical protein